MVPECYVSLHVTTDMTYKSDFVPSILLCAFQYAEPYEPFCLDRLSHPLLQLYLAWDDYVQWHYCYADSC